MAILIVHRARGANHAKKPASKAKGNEKAARARSVLLVASPTPMNIAIPPRPMKKAKIENAIPIPNPDLLCISSILSARFYMEQVNYDLYRTPLYNKLWTALYIHNLRLHNPNLIFTQPISSPSGDNLYTRQSILPSAEGSISRCRDSFSCGIQGLRLCNFSVVPLF